MPLGKILLRSIAFITVLFPFDVLYININSITLGYLFYGFFKCFANSIHCC